MLVHFEDAKPFLDIEGHACRLLEAVYITDPESKVDPKAGLGASCGLRRSVC
jgi:hypothetical protein